LPIDPFAARVDQSCRHDKGKLLGQEAEVFKKGCFHRFQTQVQLGELPEYFGI